MPTIEHYSLRHTQKTRRKRGRLKKDLGVTGSGEKEGKQILKGKKTGENKIDLMDGGKEEKKEGRKLKLVAKRDKRKREKKAKERWKRKGATG